MVSESVRDLMKHKLSKRLAVPVLEGWAWGCRPRGIRLPLPSPPFKARSAREGDSGQSEPPGLTLCGVLVPNWHRLGHRLGLPRHSWYRAPPHGAAGHPAQATP